ncbi:MAG: dihydroneopterin aldolase [Acidimicrobiia bacterium]|nr:dihydroneopterin aldolase [Acidimicrobiia bacterium]MYC57638.1 dihydroneopterin aldolase [Acidimicrobiia bacterium]MYG94438.1 dihydroneopterin aldolase [Acidimicrobiia bacterium]MYI30709.1 dihydroneopterin aldolase [Acidimicrobiia bacterium]
MSEDRLFLRGLQIMALCGALPEEQTRAQPFEMDIELGADLVPSGVSDQLGDTVDYSAVCAAVCAVTHGQRFELMEAMAHKVAEVCFGCDERVVHVTVEVRKLRPPVPYNLAISGVRITRRL